MSRYRLCSDCPAPVKFARRDRCHTCHRRAQRAALKRCCERCTVLRHLNLDGLCASCTRADVPPKAAKTVRCVVCGEQRINVGGSLCNRCNLADPHRPFRYAAGLAGRTGVTPPLWWDQLVVFVAARHHPSGAVALLRATGRLLAAEPSAGPHRLLMCCANDKPTNRALTAFFTAHGLALPSNDDRQRAAATRAGRYLEAVPTALAATVGRFHQALLDERERARRTGRRRLTDTTIEAKLRILRDLAVHLNTRRTVTGWAEITTADLEGWISRTPNARHQSTYVLRGFFAWAKHHKVVLVDPARPLRVGPQPGFTGTILDIDTQRALLDRWSDPTTHPHERFTGLLALLHAASNSQIRAVTLADINPVGRTLTLAGRPFPTPLDPATWAALDACLRHRDAQHTLNDHLIVTDISRTRDTTAHTSYLSRKLRPSHTTPAVCRQTRIANLVGDLDPKLTAAALGMNGGGLVRYLDDNIAHDRLTPTARHP